MRNIILVFLIFLGNLLFAQTKNPAYFIGTYDHNDGKGFMCHDRGMERQEVKDYNEYDLLRNNFRAKYKTQNPGTTYIGPNRAVIIYEYQKRVGGWNCYIKVINVQEGRDPQNIQEYMDKNVARFPNDYYTKPVNIFEWVGKGKNEIPKKPNIDPTKGGDKNKGDGNADGKDTETDVTKNDANTTKNKNTTCPPYGFKLSNTPSYNCVALAWWSLSTKVNSVDAKGNFKQSGNAEPKYFIIEFRRQGEIYWTTDRRDNTGRNVHTLNGLDACTQYEVRLTADCGNNNISNSSNIVRFKTACNMPGKLSVENITFNSAKISSQRLTASITHPCSSTASTQIRIIEYKSTNGIWEEVICNSGSPCFLNALIPGMVYRVRARYKYGENLYSNYTNELSFTTKSN